MSSAASRRLRRGAGAIAGAVLLAAAPAGWLITDRLERDDDFCNACHLEPGVPLHLEIRRGFDARPPPNLAAAHAAAGADRGDSPAFRCIDCHGGASAAGRARVKLLAARDAFWYVVGRFEEPDAMDWPLWDEDCARCHADFDTRAAAEWQAPRFHQLPVHNVSLGIACVECHPVHAPGGAPESHFLQTALVRAQCARCHVEFEEEER